MNRIWIAVKGEHVGPQRERTANDVLLMCNARKWRLLTNKEHEIILQQPKKGSLSGVSYDAWTGTYGAYAAPGEKLGDTVVSQYNRSLGVISRQSWTRILEVPAKYRNESDALLVVEHNFMHKLLFTSGADGMRSNYSELNSMFNRFVLNDRHLGPFLAPEEFNYIICGHKIVLLGYLSDLARAKKPMPNIHEVLNSLNSQEGGYEKGGFLFVKMGDSIMVYEKYAKPVIEIHDDWPNRTEIVKIADTSKIQLVRNFPAKDGYYMPDEKFGIPVGNEVPENTQGARQLCRSARPFSGFFRRAMEWGYTVADLDGSENISRDIGAGVNQSHEAGALVEKMGAKPSGRPKKTVAKVAESEPLQG